MFENVPPNLVLTAVAEHQFGGLEDFLGGEKIDAIAAYERLIRHAQAKQLEMIGRLGHDRVNNGGTIISVEGEVAMARNVSPSAAASQVSTAMSLHYLPAVATALRSGVISELTARAIVREASALEGDGTVLLDAELAPLLAGLTPRRAAELTRHHVIAIDAEAARARAERNRAEKWVSVWTEPDGVAHLDVRGPAEQIIAAHQALTSWADGMYSTGDCRTHGAIMVDTLVERITGAAVADNIGVEVHLVMDAPTLLGRGDAPVGLTGYGPISPDVADELIALAPNAAVRRLLVDPIDGDLLVREPRRRTFTGRTVAHIRLRDRRCRQPGCECRATDTDHIDDYASGGLSQLDNAQGLCARSHTLKHLPGWSVNAKGKAIEWQTPTGHTYSSRPPPLLQTWHSTRQRQ